MTTQLDRKIRGAAIGVIAIVLFGGFLLVQDHRHGWPFARHHHVVPDERDASALPAQHAQPTSSIERVPIELPATQLRALEIQTEAVRTEKFTAPVRAVATVVVDESRISHVHTRVTGWVERLFVNTTGERVHAGQPLAALFSQELFASQNELLSALRLADGGLASAVVEAARTRLKVLGMGDAEIAQLERSRNARRLVTLTAPHGGVVLSRGVTVGTAIDPSTEILSIADLSRVWVLAEVPDAAAAQIKAGASATLRFPASGRAPFESSVEYVYPTLTEQTRTVRVRLSVANADGALRPGLYGTADFSAPEREAMTVPRDAVVYTGDAQHVFVRLDNGIVEPRRVKIGGRIGERIEVTEGLSANDRVITTGVFLIDSESRLRASSGLRHADHGGARQDDRAAVATPATQSTHAQHLNRDAPDSAADRD